MPLDCISKPGLSETVRWLGVIPVPDQVLERHKLVEASKHPGDWGYRHPFFFGTCFAASVFGTLIGCSLGIMSILDGWTGITCLAISLLISSSRDSRGRIVLKGAACWSEHYYGKALPMSMPREIALTALKLQSEIPNSWFVIGELRQESILLDPYLLLCHGSAYNSESVCLSIWDGDTILHQPNVL